MVRQGHTGSPDCPEVCNLLCYERDRKLRVKDRQIVKECDGAGGGVGEEGVVSGKDKVESDRRSKTEVRT